MTAMPSEARGKEENCSLVTMQEAMRPTVIFYIFSLVKICT